MKSIISIIIPVYNETHIILQTLSHLFNLNFKEDVEIIIVDGNPQQNTLNCIAEPRVRKIASKKGRGAQMNKGASVAKGDILLFLHADTLIPHDAIRSIQNACKDTNVAAGAFGLGIRSSQRKYRIIEKAVFLRTRITKIPYGDQAIFVKREFFRAIGGYQEIPIMEDVELMKRIKANDGMVAIIPRRVRTSPRRWEREGIFCCTLRNWMMIALYSLGMSPSKLVKFYQTEDSESAEDNEPD